MTPPADDPQTGARAAGIASVDDGIVRLLPDEEAYAFTEVEGSDVGWGDRVLVLPGEAVPLRGVVRGLLRWNTETRSFDECSDEVHAHVAGEPPGDDESHPGSTPQSPGADVSPRENDDSFRWTRTVEVDDRVEDGDVPQRYALVVEYRPRRLLPLPLPFTPLLGGSKPSGSISRWIVRNGVRTPPRLIFVVLVVTVAVMATGLGGFNPVDSLIERGGLDDDVETAADRLAEGGVGSPSPLEPPAVTVTSPPNLDSDDTSDPGAIPPPETPESTPEPDPTTTAGPAATPSPEPTADQMSTPSPEPVSASVTVTASDPPAISRDDGAVIGDIDGAVTGSLRWSGDADSVVLVFNTWDPDSGWVEMGRTTRRPSGTLHLSRVYGPGTVYVSGSRTAAFENDDDGTTRTTTGYVSVTAVFFGDGREVARTEATDAFDVTVTNVAGTGGGASDPDLDLELGASGTQVEFLGADTVAPGSTGNSNGELTNTGSVAGDLELSEMANVSYENGQTDPEASVDATAGAEEGELHEALQLRIRVERSNGSTAYVLGGESSYENFTAVDDTPTSLGELDAGETLTLVVEWRVDPTAGNEIQTDSVSIDFEFNLRER